MNKRGMLIGIIGIVISVAGCASKSYKIVDVDDFTMQWYDNQKSYVMTGNLSNQTTVDIIQSFQESSTDISWYTNSFLIAKLPITSWVILQDIVKTNENTFDIKLLNYTPILQKSQDISCEHQQYSWYMTTFSYQIAGDTFYQGQYFMIQDMKLYIISLSSDDPKDMKYFTKSIDTIQCKNTF